jgi:predicted nucleic acid-binding protein
MITNFFWDASALVKAYTNEDGSPNVKGALAIPKARGFVTDFVVLEVITALGKKLRSDHISKRSYLAALDQFRRDYTRKFNILEVQEGTRVRSHQLAEKYNRSGTSALDILHLASAGQAAVLCRPRPLVMLCADKPLMAAARAEGLGVYNPEIQPHSPLRTALNLRS